MRWAPHLDSFKMSVRFLRNGLGRTLAEAGGTEALSQAIRELQKLTGSTERDFLAVGEKLMGFRAASSAIASDMAAVVELFAGEQAENITQALNGMLEQAQDMDARIERSAASLDAMSDVARRLRAAFSGVTNMVALFRSLCTLTQIETARLGGAGADLGHLAAEIRPLSESIQTSGDRVLEACARLDRDTRSAIQRSSQVRAAELKEMRELIAGVMAGLRAFEERRGLARESSRRQAEQYTALGAAMEDLVGSIQFHDITRQQAEHVIAALRQLQAEARGRPDKSWPAQTHVIVTLQRSQLAEAARVFAASVDQMDRGMESVSGRLVNASEMLRALTGGPTASAKEDDASFFAGMEQQFSSLLETFAGCRAARDEIASVVERLKATVAGMRASVTEIQGTEIQIQRIATNATIRATHIGASAVALNKIAEVMQRLSLEYNGRTEEASQALDLASAATAHAPGAGEEQTQEAAEPGELADHAIRRRVAELRLSSEQSTARAAHVAELSARLAADVSALRQAITAGRNFAAATDRVERLLATIQAQAAQSGAGQQAASGHLEEVSKTYTMQRQRDVHEAVVNAAQGRQAAVIQPKPAPEGDLGDNVELF